MVGWVMSSCLDVGVALGNGGASRLRYHVLRPPQTNSAFSGTAAYLWRPTSPAIGGIREPPTAARRRPPPADARHWPRGWRRTAFDGLLRSGKSAREAQRDRLRLSRAPRHRVSYSSPYGDRDNDAISPHDNGDCPQALQQWGASSKSRSRRTRFCGHR